MEKIFNTDRRIRLGIWGLGRGLNFIQAAEMLNIDIVAGCDVNPEMRSNFATLCPDAFLTADETEFLSRDMDAVLVATFFPAHAEHAIRALNAGKHVLSEVTSFFTPAEGVRLAEAVEKSGKIYNLLENYPFTRENLFLAKLWKDGFFGEFQYGEFEYLHECRLLAYAYNIPGSHGVQPGYTAHRWRSWLDFHYYNTHSLGPAMLITGLRPEYVTAVPCGINLPGYLQGGGMGTATPSLIRMSNGGVVRNLMGATTGDSHTGKRIWGTRASAKSLGDGLSIRVGAAGSGPELKVEPQWPDLGKQAEAAGHGGGDFWELYYFAREFFTGEKAQWDIWSACDVTLAGIMARRSASAGGSPMEIPNFRNAKVRDRYRHDEEKQTHFDPEKIFPEGHDPAVTGRFSTVMTELCNGIPVIRAAFDALKLYGSLADDRSRGTAIRKVAEAIGRLPELRKSILDAQTIIDAYPDSAPAQAMRELLELGDSRKLLDPETVSAELTHAVGTLK